jgi:hypothetical protein
VVSVVRHLEVPLKKTNWLESNREMHFPNDL